MYSSIACVVLFLSIGTHEPVDISFIFAFVIADILLIYVPEILYKTSLIDTLIRDVIFVVIHLLSLYITNFDKQFHYACSIHTFCFLMQILIDRNNSHKILLSVATVAVLIYSYACFRRITSIHHYVMSCIWPHAVHFVANIVHKLHAMIVLYVEDI